MRRFVVVILLLAVTACGGGATTTSSSASSGPPSHSVTVHAKDSLRFDNSTYRALAGTVTIIYVDDGTLYHSLTIDGQPNFKLKVDGAHRQDSGAIELRSGSYTISCDVPGHRTSGMIATLIVT